MKTHFPCNVRVKRMPQPEAHTHSLVREVHGQGTISQRGSTYLFLRLQAVEYCAQEALLQLLLVLCLQEDAGLKWLEKLD
jgi:hypothetical protein